MSENEQTVRLGDGKVYRIGPVFAEILTRSADQPRQDWSIPADPFIQSIKQETQS